MKISQVISKLQDLKDKHGDIEIVHANIENDGFTTWTDYESDFGIEHCFVYEKGKKTDKEQIVISEF